MTKRMIALLALALALFTPALAGVDGSTAFTVKPMHVVPADAAPNLGQATFVMEAVQGLMNFEIERHLGLDLSFRFWNGKTITQVRSPWTVAQFEAANWDALRVHTRDLNGWERDWTGSRAYVYIIAGVSKLGLQNANGLGGFMDTKDPVANLGVAYASTKDVNDLVSLVAHELGHAFGLGHNLSEEPSLMGGHNGARRNFTRQECLWLASTRFFNQRHDDPLFEIPQGTLDGLPEATVTDGEHTVTFKVRVKTTVGFTAVKIMRLDSGVVGFVEAEGNVERTASVVAPRHLLEGADQVLIDVLDSTGVWGSTRNVPFAMPEIPNGITQGTTGKAVTAWAILKRGER